MHDPTSPVTQPLGWHDTRAKLMQALVLLAGMLSLAHWYEQPRGNLSAVTDFEAARYAGQWFDISTPQPSDGNGPPPQPNSLIFDLQPNGDFRITQRSLHSATGRWHTRSSFAFTVDKPDSGVLRMPLFGPFYERWRIVALDENYAWALLVNNDNAPRVLSRSQALPHATRQALAAKALALGLETAALSLNSPSA